MLGAVPGLPVLGALPQGEPAIGILGVLVPIAFGARPGGWPTATAVVATRLELAASARASACSPGIVLGLLAWWSGGAIGPGRLASVGPEPVAGRACSPPPRSRFRPCSSLLAVGLARLR